jgi:hypothetical protein
MVEAQCPHQVVSGLAGSSENNAEQDLPFNGGIAGISRAASRVPLPPIRKSLR